MAALAGLVVVLAVTVSVEPTPAPQSLLEDLQALRAALIAHGGLPGALEARRNKPLPDNSANCTNWSYDNTLV